MLNMEIEKSHIVRAVAGRERGGYYFVTEVGEGYALLADGKSRRLDRPKRKNLKHIRYAGRPDSDTAGAICAGTATDKMLIRALAAFRTAGQTK